MGRAPSTAGPPPPPQAPPAWAPPGPTPPPGGGWAPQPPGGAWPPQPPTGAAWPPPGFVPPAPQRKKAPLLISLGALALVLVILGGVAFYMGTRQEGPHYPKEWDSRVLDIVSFDEKERGLTFKHPVEIEFMSEDDFKAKVTTSDADLSDEDKAQMDQYEASFRGARADRRRRRPAEVPERHPGRRHARLLLAGRQEGPRARHRARRGDQGDPGPRADPRPPGPVLRPDPAAEDEHRRRGVRVPGTRRG